MTGVDYIGVTVPDLDQAHEFFVDVLGCEYMYRLGPYRDDGSWMSEHMAVDDRTVMRQLRFYRLGGRSSRSSSTRRPSRRPARRATPTSAATTSPATSRTWTPSPTVLGDPTASRGPSGSRRWVCFLSPWGMQCELVSYPNGKAFEHHPEAFD
ncbi:VOC family protein [Kutzneria sp. 744]|uniref:VOC family protein n=1 Tax=Kutzneria sp. (strain 744) TaxID=345341 RepID=UPI0004B479CF|nr:VOC family protein [Kutzneria sp. 744]